jgi:hypothetical protein
MAALDAAYQQLAERTRKLDGIHAGRLHCREGCCVCCVDGITVFEIEARNIRRHHAELLAAGTPHPAGGCAFLTADGSCRIYEQRPYVCRTQGYPLRWLADASDGRPVEYRDICPLNEPGQAIEGLPAEFCWTLGPFEDFLSKLQSAAGGAGTRIRLRDLFGKSAGGQ